MSYKISMSAVNIPEETYPLMEEALRAGKIGQTEYVERFEELIRNYVGAKFCVAVSNGTMADAVAVAAVDKFHWLYMGMDYSYVAVPALTFIAQPNSVRYNGLKIRFMDVREDWMIDVKPERETEEFLTFATDLMGRQVLGNFEIEDACESFGSKYGSRFSGTYGNVGTYSFFPSHTISTGEGGAIVTDIEEIANLCRSMRAHGAGSNDPMDKFHFPYFGFNARMTTMQAVLGIALMGHIDEYISTRRTNFKLMQSKLGGFDEREGEEIVPHGYPVGFESEEARDRAMLSLIHFGVECRKFFSCIPKEENVYRRAGDFPVAEHIAHTHLYLPCHQNLSVDDVLLMCELVSHQKGVILNPR